MSQQLFYDPAKTYDDNFDNGPFGIFTDNNVYKDEGEPKYEFLGFKIYLPFGIPAGPLPNGKFIKGAFDKGFDVNVYKTQRSVVFKPNEFPNVIYVDANEKDLSKKDGQKRVTEKKSQDIDIEKVAITNSFGNPSRGPEFWPQDLKEALKYEKKGQLLIGSVVGTIQKDFSQTDYYDDFAHTAALAESSGVKVIEFNLSCPNVASEGILCYTPEAVAEIASRIRKKVSKPLIAKMGYFTNDQQKLLEEVVEILSQYVDAISAINTIPAEVVNARGEQALPGKGRLTSGLCGAPIKWAGVEMTQRLHDLREKKGYKYQIVGVGGCMNYGNYKEYRDSGADLVQSATGAMWNPYLAQEIKASLKSTNSL